MATDAIIATLVLGAMCFAMWFLARVARRRMGIGAGTVAGSGLRVVGKRPLDQKSALYVIEIAGGRHILVGASMDGGGVTKVDDISPEEYAAMTIDAVSARPKLRVAGDADAAEDAADEDSPVEAQRFATVGESFGLLLGKARNARAGRRDASSDAPDDDVERKASGQD